MREPPPTDDGRPGGAIDFPGAGGSTAATASPPPFEPAVPRLHLVRRPQTPSPTRRSVIGYVACTSRSRPGLEERLGTRWVVWIGGLTLALGGLFLVKYSIEAGLLGPGVRVLLGGLFATFAA